MIIYQSSLKFWSDYVVGGVWADAAPYGCTQSGATMIRQFSDSSRDWYGYEGIPGYSSSQDVCRLIRQIKLRETSMLRRFRKHHCHKNDYDQKYRRPSRYGPKMHATVIETRAHTDLIVLLIVSRGRKGSSRSWMHRGVETLVGPSLPRTSNLSTAVIVGMPQSFTSESIITLRSLILTMVAAGLEV